MILGYPYTENKRTTIVHCGSGWNDFVKNCIIDLCNRNVSYFVIPIMHRNKELSSYYDSKTFLPAEFVPNAPSLGSPALETTCLERPPLLLPMSGLLAQVHATTFVGNTTLKPVDETNMIVTFLILFCVIPRY